MPVTTRRRAAALAVKRPSALKTPTRRTRQTPPLKPIKTTDAKRSANGKVAGSRRRQKSFPIEETHDISCRFGHRLYTGEGVIDSAATISPKLKSLLNAKVEHQAAFYERKLAQVSADLAATGDAELWKVHHIVDMAVAMLRHIGKA